MTGHPGRGTVPGARAGSGVRSDSGLILAWSGDVDIGRQKRIIEVEPESIPVPEELPEPEAAPQTEPEPVEPAT